METMKKIIIAEDDPILAKLLNQKFKSEGWTVTVVHDGVMTLAKLKNEKFNLLLLDLLMPVKDGWQVLKEMKEQGIKTPVVVLTNVNTREDLQKAYELGAEEVFLKIQSTLEDLVTIANRHEDIEDNK